ncbi:ribonuclease HII [bacterium]|nr:ribonuclease HII [bacterium]
MNHERLRPRVPAKPSIRLEKELAAKFGGTLAVGVDEAGRGPLAGPVVAAAVILDHAGRRPEGLNDSKKLDVARRERLFRQITTRAIAYGIGVATVEEIDMINILEATRLAARRALDAIPRDVAVIVTDCLELPGETRHVVPIIKGDAICASISAASILAKVTRDRLMTDYAEEFPEYNWTRNRGYPTPDHYAALTEHGPCTLHRLTFSGVGFFHSEPRWSPSGSRLREALGNAATQDSRLALAHEVESIAPRLPPLELTELRRLLNQD